MLLDEVEIARIAHAETSTAYYAFLPFDVFFLLTGFCFLALDFGLSDGWVVMASSLSWAVLGRKLGEGLKANERKT